MGSQPFIGQVKCFAFPGVPRGWAACNGQLLAINQNQALFAILGTTYGGNGTTTFALPDLRGRTPIHAGQGSGLTPRSLGGVVGEETHTVAASELPSHTHTLTAATLEGDSAVPSGAMPAKSGGGDFRYGATGQAGAGTMSGGMIPSAASQPHPNLMPYLCMNYCIATVGIFPSHS